MPRTGRVEAEVSATPEQVWAVLSDVTRIGEWSHECRTAQWLDGAREAAVGARFRGANKARFARWSKPCTITELEAPHRLVYRTNGGIMGDATEWTFTLEPSDSGCLVVQSYEILSLPRAVEWAILMMVPEHLDRSAALREDLVRLGAVAAGRPVDEHATRPS
ncbi:MAG TPA: SRPBCC family protein, partial [Nocardioidaceae bacterium]|nr:SRPBCC family protein [Nocardioidaceae bacterium]